MSARADGLLVLEEVTCGYVAEAPMLREVSLDVQKGEVVAVVSLDASGGKSTLVKTAGGLLPPWQGAVRFEGRDVYRMGYGDDQRFRARCAVILEGGALLVNQTVRDNVAFPLRYHAGLAGRELEVRVDALLEQAGFVEDAQAFPWQVSIRGRRQAALARALARDPALVIVDRFFEGLEMPDWKRLFEVVLELNQAEGTTWLLVSEVDPAIFQVAERVAVLEGGRVLDYGHRKQLYRNDAVRRAFEVAAEDRELASRRKSGRLAGESSDASSSSTSGDSERILVVESGDEIDLLASGSQDEVAGDAETTIVIDGKLPTLARPLDATDVGLDLDRTRPEPPPKKRPPRAPVKLTAPPRLDDDLDDVDGTITLAPPKKGKAAFARPPVGEETITIDGVVPPSADDTASDEEQEP